MSLAIISREDGFTISWENLTIEQYTNILRSVMPLRDKWMIKC